MDPESSPMMFDLTPTEIPVTVGGEFLILREADEDAAVKYRSRAARAAVYDDGAMVGIKDIGDVEPFLLSTSLYRAQGVTESRPDGWHNGTVKVSEANGLPDRTTLVPEGKIRGWPSRVVKPMFDRLQEISDLRDADNPDKLRRQIARLQKRLAALEPAAKEEREKNSLPAGENITP